MSTAESHGEDPTLLRVKGEGNFEGSTDAEKDVSRKEYIKKLSSATLTVIGKHGTAKLKAVGQAALGNAIKAIIVAKGEAVKKGLNIVIDPSFGDANFDGNIKTAYILKIVANKEQS